MIVVDQLPDCLVLQKKHIEKHDQCNLTVYATSAQKQSPDDSNSTAKWKQSVHHLLHTFHPPRIDVYNIRNDTFRGSRFNMAVDDGTFYEGSWIKNGTGVTFSRLVGSSNEAKCNVKAAI